MYKVYSRSGGYTITEVMIVLAVSGALIVSAMVMLSGRQRKVEFTNSVRDFDNTLHDIANDVATGYFTHAGSFKCNKVAGKVSVTPAGPGQSQGTSDECIMMGRVFQFARNGGGPSNMRIYNIAGLRQYDPGGSSPLVDVQQWDQAKSVVTAPSTGHNSFPDIFDESNLTAGTIFQSIVYYDGAASTNIGGFAFLTSLPSAGTGNGLAPGSSSTLVVPITNINMGDDASSSAIPNIETLLGAQPLPTYLSGSRSITICLKSAASNQYGVITLGATSGRNSGPLTTSVEIKNGSC